MDLNHPLAGLDLLFKGEIVENREATNEEVQQMLNHISGEGGCGGCGCDHDHQGEGCGCGTTIMAKKVNMATDVAAHTIKPCSE